MAADPLDRFPPRRKGSAVLTNEDERIGDITLCGASELGASVPGSWTKDDVATFGSAGQAVADLGLNADLAEVLTTIVGALKTDGT